MPEAAMTYAIEPKTRADEDKLAPALHKLMEDDPMVKFYRDPQTNEFLVSGAGQPHIEAIVSKLSRRYHTNVILHSPKVPILKPYAQGRGPGQAQEAEWRPRPVRRLQTPHRAANPRHRRNLCNEIFGGAIPRQYPRREKGVRESAAAVSSPATRRRHQSHCLRRQLPRRRLQRNVVQDGRAHRLPQVHGASQTRAPRAHHEAGDRSSHEFAGALMGDLSGRRGRVQGMESGATETIIRAEVPMPKSSPTAPRSHQ